MSNLRFGSVDQKSGEFVNFLRNDKKYYLILYAKPIYKLYYLMESHPPGIWVSK